MEAVKLFERKEAMLAAPMDGRTREARYARRNWDLG